MCIDLLRFTIFLNIVTLLQLIDRPDGHSRESLSFIDSPCNFTGVWPVFLPNGQHVSSPERPLDSPAYLS
jgi:hypothetical protein